MSAHSCEHCVVTKTLDAYGDAAIFDFPRSLHFSRPIVCRVCLSVLGFSRFTSEVDVGGSQKRIPPSLSRYRAHVHIQP